ncbi:hypothetical protein CgunFtcFv8_005841 [Champsocephalus gunnari]|uniref:Uncharacterized protein n=1 Tax=Champsocephalus gunnari TaxID=52237 RepID=A0AAN8HD55_CHAGU|nr:hypothetical protein CgunFtcFv8_005841 [Champsocephalus gunnari]
MRHGVSEDKWTISTDGWTRGDVTAFLSERWTRSNEAQMCDPWGGEGSQDFTQIKHQMKEDTSRPPRATCGADKSNQSRPLQ